MSRNDRIAVQRRLNALGYSTGGTDGVLGSRSRSAIRGWQQQNGLAVTGYLNNNQLALLRDQAGSVSSNYEQQDRNYWQQTGARGGANNLRAYLDRYPDGIYAQTARNRLAELNGNNNGGNARQREERAWNRARDADSVQAYNGYLQNWPRGAHAQQARQRRDRLLQQGQFGGGGAFGLDAESIIRELIR
ncbi:peptidoglycan-binding protein [Paracoccus cavernae]|uniref:Peptidoglycan-binding protein n=2 Tax=Paracoccus cavernae TaxID=1571207 RepID=A0ABT8DC34_9RHOB|nr:peptidoglycan-binding protein [Paracoccus cavernae]